MRTADVVVVGAGVIGASIAYHLSLAGARVVVCEQGVPLAQGATARSGGLVRMHHSDPYEARLALLSLPVFESWADAVGGSCGYCRTGFALLVAADQLPALTANVAALTGLGVQTSLLSAQELAVLRPELELQATADGRAVAAAAWEPRAGYVDPSQVCRCYLDRAAELGARLLPHTLVRGLDLAGSRVRGVRTDHSAVAAGSVVVAAGGWARELLSRAGVPVPVTPRRISIGIAGGPGGPVRQQPCTVIDDTTGMYFRPAGPNRVLFGIPTSRPEAAPGCPEPPDLASAWQARDVLAGRLPGARGAPVLSRISGVDGYTPDRHAVLGPVPGLDGGYLAAGFSGGGAKTAPAVGAAVAAELVSGRARAELLAYRPQRFAGGQPVIPAHPYLHL